MVGRKTFYSLNLDGLSPLRQELEVLEDVAKNTATRNQEYRPVRLSPTQCTFTSVKPSPLSRLVSVCTAFFCASTRIPSCSAAAESSRSACCLTSLSRFGSGVENNPVSREYTRVFELSNRVVNISAPGKWIDTLFACTPTSPG